ncbi:hypothetical protein PINS_up010324 [Pythium insidiosum]|nr:hypothetical protein PINS_up010324 [Pythium insidiosum]
MREAMAMDAIPSSSPPSSSFPASSATPPESLLTTAPPLDETHDVSATFSALSDADTPTTNELLDESDESASAKSTPRGTRSRYAKFTAAMDVKLLDIMRAHNPFAAKHGTRLKMWQEVARKLGVETMENPEAFSWHTCR